MFRVEFVVDDKHLPAALRALVGIAYGPPTVTPMVNAEPKPNGLAAATDGTLVSLFFHWLSTKAPKSFVVSDVRQFLASIGAKESNAGYVLKTAVRDGQLKKHGAGSAMSYSVVRP